MATNLIYEPRTQNMTREQRTARRDLMMNNPPHLARSRSRWVDRTEAAAVLGVSTRTIDRLRKNGDIGYCRGNLFGFAASIRFWADDVRGRKELHP